MGERVRLGSGGVTVRAALPAGLTLLLTVALVFAFGVLRATDARASVVLCDVVSSSVQFSDIGSSPYKTAIEALASAQIINGYADGTFRPDDPVIRQQFAKMIVLSLGLTVKLTDVCPFADVVDGGGTDPLYPAHYVAVCASNKITEGKSPGRFDPYENITRAQIASMVVRAAQGLAPAVLTTSNVAGALLYDAPPHTENLAKATVNGLLNGLAGFGKAGWDPWKDSTRGEVAQVLYNLRERARPGSLLYSDQLLTPSGNWQDVSTGGAHFDYEVAGYVGEAASGGLASEARTKLTGLYADFRAEFTATPLSGANPGFGICVRTDPTTGDPATGGGYRFLVLANNHLQYSRWGAGGELEETGDVALPVPQGIVAQGMQPGDLAVLGKQNTVTCYWNGTKVVQLTGSPSTPQAGAVSLVVNGGGSAAQVSFSEFKILNAGNATTYNVTINAIDKNGTRVGSVHTGDVVDVQASGTWDMGNGNIGGPDGIVMPHPDESDVILVTEPIGELIARIGPQLLPVGSNRTFAVPRDGDLYLLFNDRPDYYGDNAGSVSAHVTVYSAQ